MFVACNKNEIDIQSEEIFEENLFSQSEYNIDVQNFAMVINKAVNENMSFRKLIKEEALKRFDGDYDVLLTNIIDMDLPQEGEIKGMNMPSKTRASTLTVRSILNETFNNLEESSKNGVNNKKSPVMLSNGRLRSAEANSSIVDELAALYPDLQVSVPVHIDDLEDDSYIPPVTFVTREVYSKESTTLVAYRGTETILLDANEAPDYAVIVVGLNERMISPIDPIDFIDQNPPSPMLTGVVTEAGLRVIWEVSTPNDIAYYRVFRKSSSSPIASNIATISSSSPKIYDDTEIDSKATYTYYVVAYNYTGESWSNSVTLTAPQKPNPVKSFQAILQGRNEIELRWDNDNSQYISSTKLYKRFQGVNSDYIPYMNFTSNDSYHFDRNVKGGDRVFYRITHNNSLGESSGKYDFVYVPYRNILEKSPVVLDRISYSWRKYGDKGDHIEGWFQGLPEFQIKVLTVDSKGGTAQVFDDKIQATSTGSFSCNNMKLFDWLPANLKWYDVLTIKVIESDPDLGSLQVKVDAKVNAKFGTDTIGGNVGLTATYTSPVIKFGNEGDDMGPAEYYTYFDPINYTLGFRYYNFKMYLK